MIMFRPTSIIKFSIIVHASLSSPATPSSPSYIKSTTSSYPRRVAFTSSSWTPRPSKTFLSASKSNSYKKKKNPQSSNGRAGFGKSPPQRSPPAEASIIYPQLEAQVRQTLVPSPTDGTNERSGGILSEEMYDRLEDIYGLDKFNFGGVGAIYKSIGVSSGEEEHSDQRDATAAVGGSGSLFDDILNGGSVDRDNTLDGLFGSSTSKKIGNKESTKYASNQGYDLNLLSPFTKFRVLHTDPMVLAIDDFFTPSECDRYIQISQDCEEKQQSDTASPTKTNLQPMLLGQSQTVGKDSRSKAQRTSTTWFHYYEGVPELMVKASRLLGLEGIHRWEEPQTVRYRRNEKFTWHLDALSPDEAMNQSGAGQRVATLLVYLTDLPSEDGGATMFRDLGGGDGSIPLKVRPKKGSALLFFPSAGGIPDAPFDIRTLHCGEAVSEDAENEKWIAQLWLRQRKYTPTAPPGNDHDSAVGAMGAFCESGESA
ncbi:hypothetical protein HJC23_004436 [Cyclotella cryptica]|uniref:Fe2OG dioxygenase domain-containing protein n=1 Tax=Cyclotella cryptica TaxID=29204 RepID=A0ABD3QEU2_9STRA